MFECEKCKKVFRDRYNLTKHQSRIRPCKKNMSIEPLGESPKCTLGNANSSLGNANSSMGNANSSMGNANSSIDKKINCVYCLISFKTKQNKNKHENNCKYKNDPIRLLEIEKGIEPKIPENRLECRFCSKIFSRSDNFNRHIPTCKDREKYLKTLEKPQSPLSTTINNNNNNTTFNNCFFVINSNDLDIEEYLYCMKTAADEYNRSDIPKIAGESLCLINKQLIKKNPDNKFITFPHLNSMHANQKTSEGTEMITVEKGFNRILKNTSKCILNHGKEIDDYDRKNKIVGTFEGTSLRLVPQVMKEVQVIEKMGITNVSQTVLNGLKMNNLEIIS